MSDSSNDAMNKAIAAIAAATAARTAVSAAPAIEAQKKAIDAASGAASAANAAAAQLQAAAATAQLQAAAAAVTAAAKWKEKEEIIEDALEHAHISGVDVQIDAHGYTKLIGEVTSQADADTAVAMAKHFEVPTLESQLKVVAPAAAGPASDPFNGNPNQTVIYKVKAGESWWGISQRVYGDGTLWKALKAANNNPKMIHPGTEIKLVPKDTLK